MGLVITLADSSMLSDQFSSYDMYKVTVTWYQSLHYHTIAYYQLMNDCKLIDVAWRTGQRKPCWEDATSYIWAFNHSIHCWMSCLICMQIYHCSMCSFILINRSSKSNSYSTMSQANQRRMLAELGEVFTFTVSSIQQFIIIIIKFFNVA